MTIMNENTQQPDELIKQLGNAIATNMPLNVPLDSQAWDIETCAKFLKIEKKTFLNEYAASPSFPVAYKPPTLSGGGHRRWRAQEVIDWAFSNPEDKQKRRRSRKNHGT